MIFRTRASQSPLRSCWTKHQCGLARTWTLTHDTCSGSCSDTRYLRLRHARPQSAAYGQLRPEPSCVPGDGKPFEERQKGRILSRCKLGGFHHCPAEITVPLPGDMTLPPMTGRFPNRRCDPGIVAQLLVDRKPFDITDLAQEQISWSFPRISGSDR
jgi:hypothetical protein